MEEIPLYIPWAGIHVCMCIIKWVISTLICRSNECGNTSQNKDWEMGVVVKEMQLGDARMGQAEHWSSSHGHGQRGSSIPPEQPEVVIWSLLPALLQWLWGDFVQTRCLQLRRETGERQGSNRRTERGARWWAKFSSCNASESMRMGEGQKELGRGQKELGRGLLMPPCGAGSQYHIFSLYP